MRQLRLLLPVGAVALVVAFALGSGGRTTSLNASTDAARDEVGVSFVASDVVVQQTDVAGRLEYEILAAQVEQHDDEAPVVARELTLQYAPAGDEVIATQRRWTLHADEAELPEDASRLRVSGNVEVQAQLADASRPVVLRTSELTYRTGERLLESDHPVTFSWGAQQLQATGLKADFDAGTLRLESRVHGRILP